MHKPPTGRMRAAGAEPLRIFITRSPCVKPTDGRMLPLVSERPDAMSEQTWEWLVSLPFGAVLFSTAGVGLAFTESRRHWLSRELLQFSAPTFFREAEAQNVACCWPTTRAAQGQAKPGLALRRSTMTPARRQARGAHRNRLAERRWRRQEWRPRLV
jgi:hypothetical protein